MELFKATQAREIDKASVTEAESLLVNGALSTELSAPVMKAGDFYFRPVYVSTALVKSSVGFFKKLWLKLFGTSTPQDETPKLVYPVHTVRTRSQP